jgi:hypothetical protein
MDPEPAAIKELIVESLEDCTDVGLLDLIYKLLIYESKEGQSP